MLSKKILMLKIRIWKTLQVYRTWTLPCLMVINRNLAYFICMDLKHIDISGCGFWNEKTKELAHIFQIWGLWSSQRFFRQHHWRRGKLHIGLPVSESSLEMMPREMINHMWNVHRSLLLLNGWLHMHLVKKFKIPQRQLPPKKAEENSCRTGQKFWHIAGATSTQLHQIMEKRIVFESVSQTLLVGIQIKLHPAKGAALLMVELLPLRAWRKSRLEQLEECLHMHWGCLHLKEVMVHYLNRSKDPEMRCQELEKLANACCACTLYPVMHMAWDVSVMVPFWAHLLLIC